MADRLPIRRTRESTTIVLTPTPTAAYRKERGRRTAALGVISPEDAAPFPRGIGVVVKTTPASDTEAALGGAPASYEIAAFPPRGGPSSARGAGTVASEGF